MALNQPYCTCLLVLALLCLAGCGKRFSHSVQQVPEPTPLTKATVPDYSDSTITLAAGAHYDRSRLHRFLYGEHYRKAWATPVNVEVLDIGTAKGGLTPLQMGGSRQTVNLRLQNPEGVEYVLRSVDKEPAGTLPEKWQNSYFANIIRDATSATHPYAALTLPPMAKAIGIHHLEPELVYIPHDPRLGEYLSEVGGMVALMERRPTGDQSDYAPMGKARKVKSSRSAIEERLTDNDSFFDARLYLRARLFDMLIGDWSRHEDNWRWAEREYAENAYVYEAIPRDRDNVFFKLNDAIIPWVFMRVGLKPHFQTFRSKFKNLEKLNRSGRELDELILTKLKWQDWQEIADSVQQALTDEVIEGAFKAMPDTIATLTAAPIIKKLKARRDQLDEAAQRYYQIISKKVQLVGSDKHELFEVEVLSPQEVRVKIFKTKKDGSKEQQLYARTFRAAETSEIALYGLDGDDSFLIGGSTKPRIKIRVWGGAGEDRYKVEANERKLGKRVRIYDTPYRNTYETDKYTTVKTEGNPYARDFDAAGWLLRYYLD
ncbi:MAG: hypothetical protein LPK07_05525 [Hymenobacteraceae bacterium]|nr:hypothetical protein [Hymenobacteraceae bacterium]